MTRKCVDLGIAEDLQFGKCPVWPARGKSSRLSFGDGLDLRTQTGIRNLDRI